MAMSSTPRRALLFGTCLAGLVTLFLSAGSFFTYFRITAYGTGFTSTRDYLLGVAVCGFAASAVSAGGAVAIWRGTKNIVALKTTGWLMVSSLFDPAFFFRGRATRGRRS